MRVFVFDESGPHEAPSGPKGLHHTLSTIFGEHTTMSLTIPLVGMYFRPPAKEIVQALPLGTTLILQPEPDNSFDKNAVAVLVDLSDLPTDRVLLLQALMGTDFDASELCAQGIRHIGYLAQSGAKTTRGGPGNTNALMLMSTSEVSARLAAHPEGYPVVEITAQ